LAVTRDGLAVLPSQGGDLVFLSSDLASERRITLSGGARQAWHGQALVPVGQNDLLVIHSSVDTGLSEPVVTGGYGSGLRPVETLITWVHDGRAQVYSLDLDPRRLQSASDVTGATLEGSRLLLADRGNEALESCDLTKRPLACAKIADAPGIAGVAKDGSRDVFALAAFDRTLIHRGPDGAAPTTETIGPGRLDAELALGRRLFHRASETRMTGVGIACASCHPDGREDGLVWRLDGERRQTPFLAGRLTDTAPYNWRGSSPTLQENIAQTVERLKGSGLEEAERRALARYVAEGLRVPSRPAPQDPALVARGSRVFADPAVGCATCHDPDRAFTDGLAYDVGSTGPRELSEMKKVRAGAKPLDFDVPSLRYVGLSAPYFHDGSAATIEQLIEDNGDKMGTTGALSALEKKALAAYLRSL
jgi:hypothetical protein